MGVAAAAAGLTLALAGCTVSTARLTDEDRERIAAESQRELFASQEPIQRPLTLAEATARAIKYQAEHRQRRMEEAAAAAQLEVAQFDLLPKLTANAGYTTRNNEAFGFGFTPAGTIATTPSASVERTRTTYSLGLSWNLLDFGMSYYRARQLSDQKLIAEERRRKAVQTLMHDVRVAWWRAEAAERLLPAADRLLGEVEQAIDKTRLIEARKLLPPVQIATLRRALLDLSQQIAFRRQDLAQAKVELAALVNAPPGSDARVAALADERREVPDLTASIDRLEALALRARPEMAEEGYRARISADEARRALMGILPNPGFDVGRNYDSNKFLLNNYWTSAGLSVAFNLVKIFSLPAQRRSEEAQRRADDARRQAMAMAVLAQTRLAAVRYSLLADEFLIWDEAAKDDDMIVRYLESSEKVGIDNELEVIRARARAMASHINRDLAYANMQAGMARLFNSVGHDAVPQEDEGKALSELAGLVEARLSELERASFTPRAVARRPAVAVGAVAGGERSTGALVREGVQRVLKSADMDEQPGRAAEIRLDLELIVGPATEGKRTARVAVIARPGPGGAGTLAREFRTTLSEPVDDEQWRVLGEGAAYRIVGELGGVRITRPALRAAQALGADETARRELSREEAAAAQAGPLELRLDSRLGAAADDFLQVKN